MNGCVFFPESTSEHYHSTHPLKYTITHLLCDFDKYKLHKTNTREIESSINRESERKPGLKKWSNVLAPYIPGVSFLFLVFSLFSRNYSIMQLPE